MIFKFSKKQKINKNHKQTKANVRNGLKPFPTTKTQLAPITNYILTIILFLIVVGLVTPYLYYHQYTYKEGDFCPEKIISPYYFTVLDLDTLVEKQESALSKEKDIYQFDLTFSDKAITIAKEILDKAKTIKTKEELKGSLEAQKNSLNDTLIAEYQIHLSDNTLKTIIQNVDYTKFLRDFEYIFENIYLQKGIIQNKERYIIARSNYMVTAKVIGEKPLIPDPLKIDTLDYPQEVFNQIEDLTRKLYISSKAQWNQAMANAIIELGKSIVVNLGPNITFLRDETLKQRAEVKSSVPVDKITINKGEVIIDKELVNHKQKIILDKLNLYLKSAVIHTLFSQILIGLIFFIMIVIYLKRFHPLFEFNAKNILIIFLPFIIVLAISRVLLLLNLQAIAGYFFPAGVIGMLFLLLLDAKAAMVMVFFGITLFGMQTSFEYRYVVVALVGGMTGVYSLYGIKRRWDIILTGITIGFVNMVSIALVNLMNNPLGLASTYKFIGIGIANGFFCSMISISSLPIFEHFLGVTTDIRLLELTGVKHPILEELAEKAPASYQHSLNLSKLAEAASDAIGGRYLLVRAGAYFHDIGKAKNSKYFSENQMTEEEKSLHNELTPKQSADIIKRHVLDGVEMAKKYHLPQPVIDIIAQHHGDSIISFFYDKALKQNDSPEVDEEDFRYPCPKPQSSEAGIVLLADAVEAATTSVNPKSEEEIQSLVAKLINDKFVDGQLNECALTLQQLHKIGEAFVKQLISRYHKRIAYPWQKE